MDRLKSLDLTIELLTRGTLDAVSCGAFSDLYPNDFPFNGTDLVLTTALDAQVGSFDAAFRIFSALLPHWAIYSLKFWPRAEAPAHCEIIDHNIAVVSAKRGDKASRRTQRLSAAYAPEAADMLPAIHAQQKIIREAQAEIKRIRDALPSIKFEQLVDLVRASEHVFTEGEQK